MTREKLREEIIDVLRMHGFLAYEIASATDDILVVFCNYELEKLRPVIDPPIDRHEVLLLDERGERYLARYQNSAWVSDAGFRIIVDDKKSFWCELPQWPTESANDAG